MKGLIGRGQYPLWALEERDEKGIKTKPLGFAVVQFHDGRGADHDTTDAVGRKNQ